MKRSNRLVLLIGALLAVVAFVGVVLLLGNPSSSSTANATPTPPTTANVVEAKVDIPIGTTITADMVGIVNVPIAVAQVAGDTIPDPGLAIGQVVRHPITTGAIVRFANFIDNGTATNVTDNLPAGLRAIAVQVDQITGVGTLIHTGDSVDVIIALKIQPIVTASAKATTGAAPSIPAQSSVKLIIQNAKVVGTLLPPPPAAPAAAANAGTAPSPSAAPVSSQPTVTFNSQQEILILAVTADQAEVIRFSQLNDDSVGNAAAPDRGTTAISVVLRSPKDYIAVDASGSPIPGASAVVPPLEKTDGAILKILVDKYGVLPPDISIQP